MTRISRNPLNWGLYPSLPESTRLRVRLSNVLALCISFCLVLTVFTTESSYVVQLEVACIVALLAVPVLNLLGLDLVGRLVVSTASVLLFLLIGTSPQIQDLDREQYYRLFIFGQVFIPLAVFSSRELFYQVLGAGLVIGMYFLYPVVDEVHNVFPQFPPSNKAVADIMLSVVGPMVIFFLVIGSFVYFQWAEARATREALKREQESNEELRVRERELAQAVRKAEQTYNEAKQSEETLLAKNAELAQQTERLEEARDNMRRLIKRLRTGQVQLEEQQTLLAERQFVDAGLAQLSQAARYQTEATLQGWGQQVIEVMLAQLDAATCALYLLEGNRLRAVASPAHVREGVPGAAALAYGEFLVGEGSVGAVAQRGTPIVTAWPETGQNGHLVATSLFAVKPSEVYTLPIAYAGSVLGVVEVTCLSRLEPRQRAFLIRTPEVLGPSLHAFLAQLEIKRLLTEAQVKTEALLAQEGVMRQNIEELEATQEQMRQTQAMLVEQEANLNAVLNATEDSIALVDRQYNLVLSNRAMRERYARYGVDLKPGKNAFESMPDKSLNGLWKDMYDKALSGEAQHFMGTRTDQGQLQYVEYSINPVPNAKGEIIGASVFSRDVTERVKAENAIKASERQLRELNETLEDQVTIRTKELSLNASILGTTLDTTMDGILVSDPQGAVLMYNRQFLDLWQPSPEEEADLKRTGAMRLILTRIEAPDAYERHVLEVESQNLPYSEIIIHTHLGRVVRVFSKLPVDSSDAVGRVWGFTDITELHTSEQQLRQSELRFRRFFELAQEGLLFHENGFVTDLNPSIANMFGITLEEGVGINIFDFVHPDELAAAREYFSKEQEYPFEMRVVTRQGKVLNCEIVARNLDLDGRNVRAVAVRDITERLQAENQFIAIARANPIPLLIFRYEDAIMLYANQHFEQLLGYRYEEVVGGPTKLLYYYEEDKARLRDLLRVTNGRIIDFEIAARKKDGEPIWVVLSSERVLFRGEEAIILTFYDVTERRAFEQSLVETKNEVETAYAELRAARDQLALSEKLASLGQIIAGVAHEINTPVAAVGSSAQFMIEGLPPALQGYVELILRLTKKEGKLLGQFVATLYGRRRLLTSREERGLRKSLQSQLEGTRLSSPEDAARMLVEVGFQADVTPFLPLLASKQADKILQAVFRLGQNFHTLENLVVAADKTRTIVSALKRFTHLGQSNAEERDDEQRSISLTDNLNTILILYSHQIRKTALLTTNFEGDLYAIANGDRLGQVWTNLITNALQAMPTGGELIVELFDGHLDGEPKPGRAVVRVTDTGTGIPDHVLPRIFEPFYTTKPKGEGTGIGLHISRQIVESYGGTIYVESRPGRTAFTIELPQTERPAST